MTRFSIDSTFETIARAIVRFRWLVLVFWLLAAVVASSGAEASQVRAIGLGLAAGILMDTFLVRTRLVPATVMLLGRFNWWPSAMSRVEMSRRPDSRSSGAARPGAPSEVRS